MTESSIYKSLQAYQVEQIAFDHLKQIFSEVERETLLEPPSANGLHVDILARSTGGRTIVFEVKHVPPGRRLPHSSVLNIVSLKEAISRIPAETPSVLVLLTTVPVDSTMQDILAEAGVPAVVLGESTNETRERLKRAFSQFSITLPEFLSEQLEAKAKVGTCLVTMPSSQEYNPVFDRALQPAILASGFDLIRWPQIGHIDSPIEEILKILRRAQVVVADVTDYNPNVLFNAGAAYGMGREVVFVSRQDTQVPSDLRSFRHLHYINSPKGFEQLRTSLQEMLAPVQQQSIYASRLRKMLISVFDDNELTSLCYDSFPEVYNSFSSGMTKASRVQSLLEYCQRQDLFKSLLRIIQSERPTQYAEWLTETKEP